MDWSEAEKHGPFGLSRIALAFVAFAVTVSTFPMFGWRDTQGGTGWDEITSLHSILLVWMLDATYTLAVWVWFRKRSVRSVGGWYLAGVLVGFLPAAAYGVLVPLAGISPPLAALLKVGVPLGVLCSGPAFLIFRYLATLERDSNR